MPPQTTQPPQYVKLPDGSYGQFPASMTNDQIASVIQKQFGAPRQAQGIESELPSNVSIKSYPLAEQVKDQLKRLGMGAKEVLPAVGAGTAVALTPVTGGGSDALLAAILGGFGGNALKEVATRYLDPRNAPRNLSEAVNQDAQAGLEQGAYEAGGKALDTFLGRWAEKGVANAARRRIANLTGMAGATGETGTNLSKVLPDMDQTIASGVLRDQYGMPRPVSTPRDVFKVIKGTNSNLDQSFNQELYRVGNKRVIPAEIARKIRALITPDMRMTAEGRAEARELEAAAREYERPVTINQLNSKRMTNNSRLISFYNKESAAQTAALTATQIGIMKAVRDGAADIVYRELDQLPNSMIDATLLKQKQGALWHLADQLNERADRLADEQLAYEGRTLREKINPRGYLSATHVGGYFRGIEDVVPGGGPEKAAEVKARKAFEPGSYNTIHQLRAARSWPRALQRQALIRATPLANFLRAAGAAANVSGQEDQSAR